MLKWKHYFKGSAWVGGSKIIIGIINLFIISHIIKIFGFEKYGVLVSVQLFSVHSGILILLTFGLREFIQKYTSQFARDADERSFSEFNSMIALSFFAISPLILLILFYLFDFIADYIKLDQELHYIFSLYLLSVPLQILNLVLRSSLEGYQLYDKAGLSELVSAVVYSLSLFVFLNEETPFSLVIFLLIFYYFIQFVTLFALWIRAARNLSFSTRNLDKHFRNYLKFFLLFLSSSLSSSIFHHSPKLIILNFLNTDALAIYDVAIKIPRFIKALLGMVNSISLPFSSYIDDEKDKGEYINKLFNTTFRFNLIASSAFVFPLLLYGNIIFELWLPMNGVKPELPIIMSCFLIMTLFGSMLNFGGPILIGTSQHFVFMTFVSWSVSIISLIFMFVFVQTHGIYGLVIGQMTGFIMAPYVMRKYSLIFRLDWSGFYYFIVRGLMASSGLICCFYVLSLLLPPNMFFQIAQAIICGICVAGSSVMCFLTKHEQRSIYRYITSKIKFNLGKH